LTFGRFLGDEAPRRGDVLGWARWWMRVLFLHAPARIAVYVGDLSQHDLHHRVVMSDWANAAYVRAEHVRGGAPGWPVPYFDVMGSLWDHVRVSMDSLSRQRPVDPTELSGPTSD